MQFCLVWEESGIPPPSPLLFLLQMLVNGWSLAESDLFCVKEQYFCGAILCIQYVY